MSLELNSIYGFANNDMDMQVPLGLSIAANIRVGNELGAGNPLRAKRASYAAFIIAGRDTSVL